MTRFIVEGKWDDEVGTITRHLIDAEDRDTAAKLVSEVLEADGAYDWTFDRYVSIDDEIAALRELAAEPGPHMQEQVLEMADMERCSRCKKIFNDYVLENGLCEKCLEATGSDGEEDDEEEDEFEYCECGRDINACATRDGGELHGDR